MNLIKKIFSNNSTNKDTTTLNSTLLQAEKHIKTSLITKLNNLDELEGRDFEVFLEEIFELSGYNVELTPYKNDHGIDLFITKNNVTFAIQAKKRKLEGSNMIKIDHVRDFVGALHPHKSTSVKGVFITTHYFTPEAKRFAKDTNIELIDRKGLITLISQLDPKLLSAAYYTKTTEHMGKCPKCKSILLIKYGKGHTFKGCSQYPDCRYKEKATS